MAKTTVNYFDKFVEMVDCSCEAATRLEDILKNFDTDTLASKIDEMHTIEHKADTVRHSVITALAKEFLPPIEREDIIRMVHELDNVTDDIEDVLMRLYMFNITQLRPEAFEFAKVITQCCEALRIAARELHRYKKSQSIHGFIVEVNRLEEVGDKLYINAIRNLYVNCQNPIEVIAWSETFDRFEKCCDACEHAANVIESVMMKNS